jgi:hypothetical protein
MTRKWGQWVASCCGLNGIDSETDKHDEANGGLPRLYEHSYRKWTKILEPLDNIGTKLFVLAALKEHQL